MITSDLIEYIKNQLSENISKQEIINSLLSVGWKIEDIYEGFDSLVPQTSSSYSKTQDSENVKTEQVEIFNLELPEGHIPSTQENGLESKKIDPILPKIVEPKVEPVVYTDPVSTVVEKTIDDTAPSKEILDILNQSIHDNGGESSSVYPNLSFENKKENNNSSIGEELFPIINKNNASQSDVISYNSPTLSNKAMISSYALDMMSAQNNKDEVEVVPTIKKKSKLPLLLMIIGAFLLIGGVAFAFIEGYIKIPWLDFKLSIVKNDPKSVLLSHSMKMKELNYYKVDSQIDFSLPSLSSITTGLASGESAVVNSDRDLVSIVSKGKTNKINGKLTFDQDLKLKSSILENEIDTNLKYDGENIFIKIPDFKEVFGVNAPNKDTLILKQKESNLLIDEISLPYKDLIKNIDAYNILSGEVPLYVKNEVSSIIISFINSTSSIEKGEEVIDGIDVYHYELTADRQSAKKLLSSFSDLFLVQLPEDQKKQMYEAFGSTTISSFDVWIGRNDDNLYKIKISLNIPLSKVLDLNDSGIAGGEVKIDWSINYYDLDIPNEIVFPKDYITVDQFIKDTKNIKIKNIIDSFKPNALMLKNAIGSYGNKINNGSCLSPVSGSLYSPLGHTKGAVNAVASISDSLNSLLSLTQSKATCYSNSKSWALSAPLYNSSDKINFYCADSNGKLGISEIDITNSACN